jgi:hypothetical protein
MLISRFEFPVALYFTVIAGTSVDFAKREKDKPRQRVVTTSPLSELALVLVRLDHVARCIVNTDHRIM